MALRLEWDDDKARDNQVKHGVSFEAAQKVFEDERSIDLLDDRQDYGEDRYNRLGAVNGIVLFVVYTERKDSIRIISARRAVKDEEDFYYAQNHQGRPPDVGRRSRGRRPRRS